MLRYFERRKAVSKRFSSETVEALTREFENASDVDQVHEALGECLSKLPADQHELIRQHYLQEGNLRQIAERLGLSVFTLYKRMANIRRQLLECIRRSLNLNWKGE